MRPLTFFQNLIFLAVFCLTSCQGEPQNSESCKYGKPQAIFSDAHEGINKQSFELNQQGSVERVSFSDGQELEVYQSGCEELKQTFQFQFPGDYSERPDSFWIAQSVDRFSYLSSLGPNYSSFGTWAQFIEEKFPNMKLAEEVELAPGYFVKVDRIVSKDVSLLQLMLFLRE